MSNPSKAKGTSFENEVLAELRTVFPNADRAKAGNESCDFSGTGAWVFEAKHRKVWDFRTWIHKIRKVSTAGFWAIFAADGDRRKTSSVGNIVMIEQDTFLILLECWEQRKREIDARMERIGVGDHQRVQPPPVDPMVVW